ncbi:M81 family metallopeptidase [Endozoicomonas atrinae]|uniref:M81 family metallopeptidase n=1 Tax=Endozoicomonas atrinae TaxID=1333660 RepID=UPI0008259E27|nr:M81 family metallopeptidase [Endozoicomonas atrinae]
MRSLIAMLMHETNTFSPIPTNLQRFKEWSGLTGTDALSFYRDTRSAMGAFLDLTEQWGDEIVCPVAAEAMPSAPADAETYDYLSNLILEEVQKGVDRILLALHGAMITENTLDGEGTLLKRIRAIAPDIPIAVAHDFHANITTSTVENCTVLTGYKTYPHTDLYETAHKAGSILYDTMQGQCNPVMAWRKLPLISHTLKQGTDDEPFKSFISLCRAAERKTGVLSVSIFGGFPLADSPYTGTSVVVVTDNDDRLANRIATDIAEACWAKRHLQIYQQTPLNQQIQKAKELTEGPVILLDHCDNCGSGGTQDVMTVIREVMEAGLKDVAVAAVWDPEAVAIMQTAGMGADVTLHLGGNTDMPAIQQSGQPLEVQGKVINLTDGCFRIDGPMYQGLEVCMGPTAVLDTGKMQIIVISRHIEPWDPGVFHSVGIAPEQKRYLLLKSRIHYRAGFADIARHTLLLDGDGVTTSDYQLLNFSQLKRPIFPLDPLCSFEPNTSPDSL